LEVSVILKSAAQSVPTLDEWGLIVLAITVCVVALLYLRRAKQ
jgi:hypothetical protein